LKDVKEELVLEKKVKKCCVWMCSSIYRKKHSADAIG